MIAIGNMFPQIDFQVAEKKSNVIQPVLGCVTHSVLTWM